MKELNLRIKQKRIENGLTLLEVANRLGVKEATAQRYESGNIKNIKHETICKLAEILNTTPAYLMGWEEVQKNNDILADIVIDMRTDDEFFVVVEKLYQLKRSKPEKLAAVAAVIDALIGS